MRAAFGVRRLFALILICSCFSAVSGTASALPGSDVDELSSLLGQWEPPNMDAIIDVFQCGEAVCADLVSHDYVAVTMIDINNPNPALRKRPLLGVRILSGLHRKKKSKWNDGTLYDPRTGKTYFSKLKILDRNHIRITGCLAPGLCKGYVWTRPMR